MVCGLRFLVLCESDVSQPPVLPNTDRPLLETIRNTFISSKSASVVLPSLHHSIGFDRVQAIKDPASDFEPLQPFCSR